MRSFNDFAHPIGSGKHLVVPETDDFEALAFQERGALGIVRHALGMLRAINLDDQHGIETDEIVSGGVNMYRNRRDKSRRGEQAEWQVSSRFDLVFHAIARAFDDQGLCMMQEAV